MVKVCELTRLAKFVSRMIAPMLLDAHYTNLKNQVIKAERRILKEFGFCMHVNHPHKVSDSSDSLTSDIDYHNAFCCR